ncbi:MAG: GTP 3',8-cyclase MoaA [Pseudomonadota bacterium]|nr:GTP 3',8-cyclase MoaA [Pseudomonadota bacterium]
MVRLEAEHLLPVTSLSVSEPVPSDTLRDSRGRPLRDLRISVTDRCNFRCTYCMPRDLFGPDHPYLPHAQILSFEEISRIAGVLVGLGVRKIRLTGGEPLLRRDIERLVAQLARLGVDDLSLTTNGSLLAKRAAALHDAGLQRVTVSLDALDDATFRRMNDADYPVARVLQGIDAAAAVGLGPIKINAVVQRGVNEHAVLDLARHFRGSGHVVRFIEYMDVGSSNGWQLEQVVPSREVLDRIDAVFPIEPLEAHYAGEVAQRWRYRDGAGEVGVISSVSQAFCSSCSRLRLSTDGHLYTCLFAQHGTDLRGWLREQGVDDSALAARLTALWQLRSDRYSELRTAATAGLRKIEMHYIGG